MNALVIAIVAPLLQDATELKWNLKEGQKFACAWTQEIATANGDVDIRFDVKGTLEVGKTTGEGTACSLLLEKFHYMTKSKDKADFEIHYEDGKMRGPDPDSAKSRETQKFLELPVSIRITPWGGYSMEPHLSKIFFDGQADCFGSHLPMKAVSAGTSWEGFVETPILKFMKARPLGVKYALESRTPDVAKLVLKDSQEVKQSRFTLEISTVSETHFAVKGGYCSTYSITCSAIDKQNRRPGEDKPDAKSVMKFEMKEKK